MTIAGPTIDHRPSAAPTASSVPGALPPRAPGQPAGSPASARPLERGAPRPALAAWAPRPPADGAPVPRCRARDETRREEERHVRALARIVALACVEAELGLRPARQLSAWLDLPTYGKMVRRADLAGRTRPDRGAAGAPQALGARCCAAAEGVYEASATVRLPDRVRAVALRIERRRERWKVTALELG